MPPRLDSAPAAPQLIDIACRQIGTLHIALSAKPLFRHFSDEGNAGAVDQAVGDGGGNDLSAQAMAFYSGDMFGAQWRREIEHQIVTEVGILRYIALQQTVVQRQFGMRQQHRNFRSRHAVSGARPIAERVFIGQSLDFAVKLTRDPSSVQREDVEGLRREGLDDQQVLSVVLITSLFNFMTRLADGLGVEFPATRQRHIESWLAGPAREQEWMMRGEG